jgi:MFS family permease
MKIFYGWRMVGAACGIQFLLAAFLTQALGLYIAVLSDEMGWSKTTLSGAAALQSVEAAIIGPVLGWIMDRVGPQKMIRLGMVLFSAGLLMLSQVNAVATFYTSAILMAIGASLSGYFPLSVALVQWFEKFRARALSIMSLGLALGGLVVPLMAWSIQTWGWRYTAGGTGLLVLLFGLPMAGMILRRPEDHGEHVDGIDPALKTVEPGDVPAVPQVEFTAAEAVKTRAFWMLAIGHGLALLVVSAVNVHAITHMKEGLGYSVATASWVILIMTFAQLVGILMGATLGDMFDKRKVAALCMLAHALGMVCLTFANDMTMLMAFGLFHGVAWGLRGPFMQAIRADYFGRNAIGLILGLSAAIIALGQIAGPMVAGVSPNSSLAPYQSPISPKANKPAWPNRCRPFSRSQYPSRDSCIWRPVCSDLAWSAGPS